MKIIKVSDKGQISIPRAVRDSTGIREGDELILFELDGKIVLEKSDRIKDQFEDIKKFNEISLKEIWGNEEDEIWNSYLKDDN
ncbi:AbrB/MazE/SpoVT family DNA-binding domain-containing protein [Candidatus Pacearchaeota archaeon]|nr:AbrB/MazE/SpoVT family DNA-binding domain-containing protein [Candidatus Pacearchaeota archaeon]